MTGAGIGPGVVVELAAAQDPDERRSPAALRAEAVALALAAVPGLVRGLLLHPELPLAGALHPALLTDARLCWCTATQMRRLRAAGAVAAVVPEAGAGGRRTSGVAAHLAAPGLPVVPIDAADPKAAVAAVVAALDGLAGTAAPRPLRIALSEPAATPISDALALRCELTIVRGTVGWVPPSPWALDAWIVHLQGAPAGTTVPHHPAVVWLDDPDARHADLSRARAAVVPPPDAERRLTLGRGLDAPPLPVAVADPGDPEGAAAAITSLVEGLGESLRRR